MSTASGTRPRQAFVEALARPFVRLEDAGIAARALSDRELALSVARHLEEIPHVCAACGHSGTHGRGRQPDLTSSTRTASAAALPGPRGGTLRRIR